MPNPDSSSDLTNDDNVITGFPYELLPNEMKVPILKNIHDPQDKLNILAVVPYAESLMDWDHTSLQFELVEYSSFISPLTKILLMENY